MSSTPDFNNKKIPHCSNLTNQDIQPNHFPELSRRENNLSILGRSADGWTIGSEPGQETFSITTRNRTNCPNQVTHGFDRVSTVVDVIKLFLWNLDFPKFKKLKKVCFDDWTWTKLWKQLCCFQSKLLITFKVAYSCCFSLGGIYISSKINFYNIDYWEYLFTLFCVL